MHRRTATKVKDGRVRKKNNWKADRGDYLARAQSEIRIDRSGPEHGRRHVLTVADVKRFLPMLPEWDAITIELDAIVLGGGYPEEMNAVSWSDHGVVGINSWPGDLWWEDDHRGERYAWLFDKFGVDVEKTGEESWTIRWTESQARAFQLLYVLPFAIAHHRNEFAGRDTTPDEARAYAARVLDEVFDAYCATFGAP